MCRRSTDETHLIVGVTASFILMKIVRVLRPRHRWRVSRTVRIRADAYVPFNLLLRSKLEFPDRAGNRL